MFPFLMQMPFAEEIFLWNIPLIKCTDVVEEFGVYITILDIYSKPWDVVVCSQMVQSIFS